MVLRRRAVLLALAALVLAADGVASFGFNFGFGEQEHVHDHAHDDHEHVDLYEILGLTMEATDAEIKKAYRKLSLQYHPDKQGKEAPADAEQKFHDIAQAYEVLSDPMKRQTYDLEGFEGLERDAQQAGRPQSPFDAFFGGGGRQRGPDAAVDMPVTLEELYNGAQKQAQFSRNVICRKCRGTGAKDGKTTTCKTCGGAGVVMVQQRMGPGFTVQMQQPCPKCGGRGKVFTHQCPHCHGNKVVKEDKVLTAEVERGMPSTHQIVFERESEQRPGMIPGDVIFRLQQVPHDRFRRAGDDLHMELQISLEEALLGYQQQFTHLDNRKVTLSSAGVTKPFAEKVVSGEGMPVHNYPSQHGDLHVHHQIAFPRSLTADQKKRVAELLPDEL